MTGKDSVIAPGDKKRRRGKKSSEREGDKVGASDYRGHSTILIQLDEDKPTWHDYAKSIKECNAVIVDDPGRPSKRPSSDLVAKYRSIGDYIYQSELQNFSQAQNKGSDTKWVESTMRKGTLKDRIAAMSVTVGSDPIHKMYALDGLFQMVGCSVSGGKTNSRVAQLAAEAVDDLFLNTFLPDRKLIRLSERPLFIYEKSSKTLSPRILLLWRFEEIIKEKFDTYRSKYVSQTLRDGVDVHKVAVLRSAAKFLRSVPESESEFLSIIVNKLGDPIKKTASAAGHELTMVLQDHPNMQIVIAREVQQLAHRPNLSPRALYNCITFLNQLKLSKDIAETVKDDTAQYSLPTSLIKTYFRLFEVAVNQANKKDSGSSDEGMKSRLLSALLSGVNRAHPYLADGNKEMENHIDALYKIVHTAAPSACTQALLLLFQVAVGQSTVQVKPDTSDSFKKMRDRFYRTVYATLSQQTLLTNGKHLTMYFNLLYKTMKYDDDTNRVNVFSKRMMCTALHESPPVVAGTLFLLNEVAKTHPELKDCFREVPTPEESLLVMDANKRDPRFAFSPLGDDSKVDTQNKMSPSWELALLAHQFHPSVAKFAQTMGELSYAGDPTKDFGLIPFLDKFAYKNPKSGAKFEQQAKRQRSVAQRRFGNQNHGEGAQSMPVNDPSFLQRESVGEQDEFFRTFFTERARRDEIKGIVRGTSAQPDDVDADQVEDEIIEAAEKSEGFDGVDDAISKYYEYEQGWETDEEEEAFVDQLAIQLIESTASGEADFDDEDPDMDGWDAMSDDNPDIDGDDDDDDVDDRVSAQPSKQIKENEDDSGDNSDDDDSDNVAGNEIDNTKEDEDEFMDEDDDDSDGSQDSGSMDPFLDDSNSDDGSDNEALNAHGNPNDASAFADASDYEKMIEKSWNEMKRPETKEKRTSSVSPSKKKRRK